MKKVWQITGNKTYAVLLFATCIVVAGFSGVLAAFATQTGLVMPTLQANGAIGDFFGGIMNPVIALLALLWLKKAVELQQKEMEETRKALEKSVQQQAAQVRIAAITALFSLSSDELAKSEEKLKKAEELHDSLVQEYEAELQSHGPNNHVSPDEHFSENYAELTLLKKEIEDHKKQKQEFLAELRKQTQDS